MCSYGSFAKGAGGAMNANLRKKADQEPDRPRGLSKLEKRIGLSTRQEDIDFVVTAQKGLIDTLGDILAHQIGDARRPTCRDVIVRIGSRASGKPSSALHEASKHGHADCCRLLIEQGAQVNFKLELSRVLIPLHLAKTTQVCQVLLRAGSYSKRQRSDKRLPDMAQYQRTQKREDVAVLIDEWNIAASKKRGRRINARQNLQMIWDRLNGMVVGLKRIRQFQMEFTEKFYSPDYGGFMKVGKARFNEFAIAAAASNRPTTTTTTESIESITTTTESTESTESIEKEIPQLMSSEVGHSNQVKVEPIVEVMCGGSGLKAALLLRQAQRCFPVEAQKPHVLSPKRKIIVDPRIEIVSKENEVDNNVVVHQVAPERVKEKLRPIVLQPPLPTVGLVLPSSSAKCIAHPTIEQFLESWYSFRKNAIIEEIFGNKI